MLKMTNQKEHKNKEESADKADKLKPNESTKTKVNESAKVQELISQLGAANAHLELAGKAKDEVTALLQRVQADFENYKKRSKKDYELITKNANSKLIASLLPILDSFQLALKNTGNHETFVKGVELIYSQLYSAFEQQGLRKIEAVGKKFDPYKHEVLLQEKSDMEEDTILEELQAGYMLGEAVLRYSKVKVATK